MSIFVDKEMRALIPPLSEEELGQLEKNCVADGIRDPLVVWPQPDGREMLIDGHNRWDISCRHGGIRFEIVRKEFKDRDEAKLWVIHNQLGRRNLHPLDEANLRTAEEEIVAKQAKERMKAGVKIDPVENLPQGKTRDIMGKKIGVSGRTYDKLRAINKSGNEEVKQAVRSGELSINQGYRQVKGYVDKSPQQSQKEFIKSVKEEREAFQKEKSEGVVSFSEAKNDKANAEILAKEAWNRCMKAGGGIDALYFDVEHGDIDLTEMRKNLPENMLQSLQATLSIQRDRLFKIMLEVVE